MKIAKIISVLILLLVLTPILFLFLSFKNIDLENWNHLIKHILPSVSLNTLILILGTGILSTLISVMLSFLQAFYNFPFKQFFHILFILPLAFPIYVFASIALSLFGITGEFTLFLYNYFSISPLLINIKNIYGLILIYSLTLYPYLYVSLIDGFKVHGQKAFEIGTNLGLSKFQILWKILIPSIKPWYFAGITLIIMEILADYGASSLFNIDTFSTAIYKSWFGLFSIQTASQIACFLISSVFLVYYFLKSIENKKDFSMNLKSRKIKLKTLNKKIILFLLPLLILFLFLSLFLPLSFLFKSSLTYFLNTFTTNNSLYYDLIKNTLNLSILGAIVVIVLSLILAICKHFYLNKNENTFIDISKMGYAIPGAIMAVAIYVPLIHLDKLFFSKPYLTLTIAPLIIGYFIRFLSISLNPLEASFKKIGKSHLNILENLGISRFNRIRSIYFPLFFKSVLGAFFLVLLEIFKELPVTLMSRPFGYDTLATKIFEYTSEGNWEDASVPAFLLFLVGCFTLLIINFLTSKIGKENHE